MEELIILLAYTAGINAALLIAYAAMRLGYLILGIDWPE